MKSKFKKTRHKPQNNKLSESVQTPLRKFSVKSYNELRDIYLAKGGSKP